MPQINLGSFFVLAISVMGMLIYVWVPVAGDV
uniref:ATPase subunit 8 n=1 Tax=Phallusia mammillata TaxID=59560 RepID=A7WL68_9ASCI|nr:ATP synthase F0 subunit 8 [Phallusia mammillata]CAL23081.2 ATPase subunit 8 [Phallusia mammillata]